MTPLEQYKAKLNEFLEADAKRTKGPWKVGYDDLSGRYDEDEERFCLSANKKAVCHADLSENKNDSEFIVLSVNNFARVVRDLQVVLDKLELADDLLHTPEHSQDEAWYERRRSIKEALEAIVKGVGK